MIVLGSSFSSSEFEMIRVPNTPSFVRELASPAFSNGREKIRTKDVFLLIIAAVLKCVVVCVCVWLPSVPCRAITLDNQLVVLATVAADAGRYHAEAVNEVTGESVTSAAIYLSVSGKDRSRPSGLNAHYSGFPSAKWRTANCYCRWCKTSNAVGSFHNQAPLIGNSMIFWLRQSDIPFPGYYSPVCGLQDDWLASGECVELIQFTGKYNKNAPFQLESMFVEMRVSEPVWLAT